MDNILTPEQQVRLQGYLDKTFWQLNHEECDTFATCSETG